MAGYVKIWTTILSSPEFKILKLNEKGAYLLMIIFSKEFRDNGHIVVNSMEEIAINMGTNRKTAVKIVEKLRTLNLLKVSKNHLGQIDIFLPNYKKWQTLTAKEVNSSHGKKVGKNSELLPTKILLPDQTRPDHIRPDYINNAAVDNNMDTNSTDYAEKSAAYTKPKRKLSQREILRAAKIKEMIQFSNYARAVLMPGGMEWVKGMVSYFGDDGVIEKGLESLFKKQLANGFHVWADDNIRPKIWAWIERQKEMDEDKPSEFPSSKRISEEIKQGIEELARQVREKNGTK